MSWAFSRSVCKEHDSVLALVNLEVPRPLRGMDGPVEYASDSPMSRWRRVRRAAAARLAPIQVRDWTQDNEAYFRAIRTKNHDGLDADAHRCRRRVQHRGDADHGGERRTDIAILRTVGLSPRGVIAVFMTQGVLIGSIGGARRLWTALRSTST